MSESSLTLAQSLIVWAADMARHPEVVVCSQAFGEPGLSRAWQRVLPAPIAQLYDELNGFALSWRLTTARATVGQLSLLRCEMPGKKLRDLSSGAVTATTSAARLGLRDSLRDPSEPLALLARDGASAALYASLTRDELLIHYADASVERVAASALEAIFINGARCGFVSGWLAQRAGCALSELAPSPSRAPFKFTVLEATPYDELAQLAYLGRRLDQGRVTRLLKALKLPVPDSLYDPLARGEHLASALIQRDAYTAAQIELIHGALATHQRGRAKLERWLGVVRSELIFLRVWLRFDKSQTSLPLEAYASCTLSRALYEAIPEVGIMAQAPLPPAILTSCFLPRVKRDYWSPFHRGPELVEPWRGRQVREATFEGLMTPALAAGLVVGQSYRSTALPSTMRSF